MKSDRKLRIGILCGGLSCEHEVSLVSAQNVIAALNPEKYEAIPILIDKKGGWQRIDQAILCGKSSEKLLAEGIAPSTKALARQVRLPESALDCVFPILHGPFGEDGTVQGFLKLAQIPFVGSSVLGAAIGMDKDVTKRLLREAGLPVARARSITSAQRGNIDYDAIIKELGMSLFVKPANLGSSVGVYKVKSAEELKKAIDMAFEYDRKILVEECVKGREVECAVLGNEHPIASTVGEIITSYEFYTYEAKYLDQQLQLVIPAKISEDEMVRAQALAIKAFQTLCCEGMARVDFFLKSDGELLINEVNTIPGFTNVSMYPKLWQASGISYPELIDRLIQLSIERHKNEANLKTSINRLQ